MKRVRRVLSAVILAVSLAAGLIPGQAASAATSLAAFQLVSATNTTATVSWNVSEAQAYCREHGWTLYGFRLQYADIMNGAQTLTAGQVTAATSTYTYTGMNPYGYILLYMQMIAVDGNGITQYKDYDDAITYDPTEYGSGSSGGGSGNGISGGGGSSGGGISSVNDIVANAVITGVSYNQQGFGKKKGLQIKWNGYSDISGYQANLYSRKGKLIESKTISNPYMNYCKFSKANTQNCYYVKVRGYYTYGGTTTYTRWSSNFNAVPQARITSGKKAIGAHSIRLTWKRVKGASKYTVYARKGGSRKWKKVKSLKGKASKYTFRKFKGKTIRVNAAGYDLQVRTTAKVNGKTTNSASYYYTHYYRI